MSKSIDNPLPGFFNCCPGVALMLLVFVFFPSCFSSKKIRDKSNARHQSYLSSLKYADMPLPVGFVLSPDIVPKVEEDLVVSRYEGSLSVPDVCRFYCYRMEHEGWDIDSYITQEQAVLVCRKISKSCVLSIGPAAKKGLVVLDIFLQDKTLINNQVAEKYDINAKSLHSV